MLNAIKEIIGDVLSVRLHGSLLEETLSLEHLIPTLPSSMTINCKNLARFNSAGTRAWIKFFQRLQAQGTQLRFTECSPAMVAQLNSFSNFACGGKVESIYAPFYCQDCRKELICLFSTSDLLQLNCQVPELNCPTCAGKVFFDDHPQDYFRFLRRNAHRDSGPVAQRLPDHLSAEAQS